MEPPVRTDPGPLRSLLRKAPLPAPVLELVRGVRAMGLGALRQHLVRRRWTRRGEPRLPGPLLMVSVAGTADIPWFLDSGARAAACIREGLERHGTRLEELGRILDFGCGCGRVVRHWHDLDGPEIFGTDTNHRSIRWCRRSLPFGRFEVNGPEPPLPFEGGAFDLIYALSVLTHLPEDLQDAWMGEMQRLLRPGGLLLLSLHGEAFLHHLDAAGQAAFAAGELVIRHSRAAGSNLCGAYHPPAYVRRHLARELELLEHTPQGARGNPPQDLVLLRRPVAGEAGVARGPGG